MTYYSPYNGSHELDDSDLYEYVMDSNEPLTDEFAMNDVQQYEQPDNNTTVLLEQVSVQENPKRKKHWSMLCWFFVLLVIGVLVYWVTHKKSHQNYVNDFEAPYWGPDVNVPNGRVNLLFTRR